MTQKLLFVIFLLLIVGIQTGTKTSAIRCTDFANDDDKNQPINLLGKQGNAIKNFICSNTEASSYWKWITIANTAKEEGDYQTAIINYQRALKERPSDFYSMTMIESMERTIKVGKAIRLKKEMEANAYSFHTHQ